MSAPQYDPTACDASGAVPCGPMHGYYAPDVAAWRAWWESARVAEPTYRAALLVLEAAYLAVRAAGGVSCASERALRRLRAADALVGVERARLLEACPMARPRRVSEVQS